MRFGACDNPMDERAGVGRGQAQAAYQLRGLELPEPAGVRQRRQANLRYLRDGADSGPGACVCVCFRVPSVCLVFVCARCVPTPKL